MRTDSRRFALWYWLLALAALLVAHSFVSEVTAPERVSYDEMLGYLRDGAVERVDIQGDAIIAELEEGEDRPKAIRTSRLPDLDESRLLDELERADVEFAGTVDSTPWWLPVLIGWMLPIALLAALYFYGMRRMARGGGGALSFGKSRVKIYDRNQAEKVTYADVAGVEEAKAELREVVDFLEHPARYKAIGARIPRGVLLVGPPGTGKTLLARAVAGEANVPFFSLSGSEFIEMFVGVGAARARDLFEQAKSRAPCIVFIDELDAIGRARGGVGAVATHDEREQTLNQLLVEIDGFDPQSGVVIMAATNRPEILDPALLRAGRFDRRVAVDRPDVEGRCAILEVHSRRIRLAAGVNLRVIAKRTPGMVGADLANVVNEAALAAARRGGDSVGLRDFESAVDRIQLGLERRSLMGDDEKRRVAFHEAGHVLVALSVDHADPVHRVTIIPRSIGSLGATLQLPTQDRYLVTQVELEDRLAVMLGGRAAEELVLGDRSTGAENDLERATETARQMVCRFGMSGRLGPITFGRPAGSRYLEIPFNLGDERNYSERTAQLIDDEVRAVIEAQYERAREALRLRRPALQRLAEHLLERETLEGDAVRALVQDAMSASEAA